MKQPFANGGLITKPIDVLPSDYVISKQMYDRLVPIIPRSESQREVTVRVGRDFSFQLPEPTPEEAARMEKIRKLVAKQIEAYWDSAMQSLVRGGHAPDKPHGFRFGDLS